MLNEIQTEREERLYKIYISEQLRILCKNVATHLGGSFYEKCFQEILSAPIKTHDTRTAEEIVDDVIEKTGLEVKD